MPKTISGSIPLNGLGQALPAELNSYPGPRHVLELGDRLALTDGLRQKLQALFDAMNPQAIALGKQILDREAKLEQAFRNKTVDETALESQLADNGKLQAQLRFVHLRTHLTTVKILTPHQISLYNTLRGYNNQCRNSHQHNTTPQP